MRRIIDRVRAFGRELERRRVYRAGALYVAAAVGLLSAADLVVGALLLDDWILTLLFVVTVTGLPVALVVAWLYDLGHEGLKRDRTGTRGLRWAFGAFVIVVSVGLGGAAWRLWLGPAVTDSLASAPGPEASGLDPARVAVLYLDDYSQDASLGAIADGLTEELTHRLSRVQGLEVVSRHGVKTFRTRDLPLDSIVRVVEAGSIVEGSVQGSRDSLRVTVQLIDASTGTHLSSLVVDRPRRELLTLIDDVAAVVLRELRARIGAEIRVRELQSRASSNEAWLLTHRAQRLLEVDWEGSRSADPDGAGGVLERAETLLTEAIALDPGWADPWVRRGGVRFLRARLETSSPGLLDPEWSRLALQDADSAVARDTTSAPAFELRGMIRAELVEGAPPSEAPALRERAARDLRHALDLDPGAGAAWLRLSRMLVEEGHFAEARRAAMQALDVDAFLEVNRETTWGLFVATLNLERLEEAGMWCEEGRRHFPRHSNFLLCRLMLMVSDTSRIEPGSAWSTVDTMTEIASAQIRGPMRRVGEVNVAKVLVHAGLPDSARAVLARAEGEGEVPPWLSYDAAHAHLLLGDPARALDLLDRYLAYQPGQRDLLARDWWFRPLWNDPRFQEILASRGEGG